MLGLHPARSDVLRRSGNRGVTGIEVEVPRILEVTTDDRTLEEVDVLEGVDEAGDVVEVGQGGLAVLAGAGIDDVHRGPRGSEVHLVPGELQIVARVLPVKHDVAGGVRHRVLDQCTREEESTFGAELPPGRGDRLDAAWNRLGQSDLLERVERRGMDPLDPVLVEGPVPAAGHTGAHRAIIFAKRGRPGACAAPPCHPYAVRLPPARSSRLPPLRGQASSRRPGRAQYCRRAFGFTVRNASVDRPISDLAMQSLPAGFSRRSQRHRSPSRHREKVAWTLSLRDSPPSVLYPR